MPLLRTKGRIRRQIILLLVILSGLFSCMGVAYSENRADRKALSREESSEEGSLDIGTKEGIQKREVGYGAWTTYWDAESALLEEAQFGDKLEELVCFEVFQPNCLNSFCLPARHVLRILHRSCSWSISWASAA